MLAGCRLRQTSLRQFMFGSSTEGFLCSREGDRPPVFYLEAEALECSRGSCRHSPEKALQPLHGHIISLYVAMAERAFVSPLNKQVRPKVLERQGSQQSLMLELGGKYPIPLLQHASLNTLGKTLYKCFQPGQAVPQPAPPNCRCLLIPCAEPHWSLFPLAGSFPAPHTGPGMRPWRRGHLHRFVSLPLG